jgi:hypothetical protein
MPRSKRIDIEKQRRLPDSALSVDDKVGGIAVLRLNQGLSDFL